MDPERMFLDYCPWPVTVKYTDQDREYMAVMEREPVEVVLRCAIYPCEDVLYRGSMTNERRAYGWEPETRTVFIYRKR